MMAASAFEGFEVPPMPPPPRSAPASTSQTQHVADPSEVTPSQNTTNPRELQFGTPRSSNSSLYSKQISRVSLKERSRNPSLSFRDRAYSIASTSSSSSVKRKPLPPSASPLAVKFVAVETGQQRDHQRDQIHPNHPNKENLIPPEQPFVRAYSIDSPTLYEFPPSAANAYSAPAFSPRESRTSTTEQRTAPPVTTTLATTSQTNKASPPPAAALPIPQHLEPSIGATASTIGAVPTSDSAISPAVKQTDAADDSIETVVGEANEPWPVESSSTSVAGSATMSIFSTTPIAPHKLAPTKLPELPQLPPTSTYILDKSPKSPGASKLGAFFGWGGSSTPASPLTAYSSAGSSPSTTDYASRPLVVRAGSLKHLPAQIDVPRANANSEFTGAPLRLPLPTPTTSTEIQDMENQLKEISIELAASIRREMELEDLVDRLQTEVQTTSVPGRRTSDYFSDSGTSSVRYGDSDSRVEELDRLQRKTEQDKASMRMELTTQVQDERSMRKHLERQIRLLEERASHADIASINTARENDRLRELESTCEDLRRRLADERQVKSNFEDLLTALKLELNDAHNERDNLRDEVVPQLRARVEGLEAQAAQQERLTYEQTKMQQELQHLKAENMSLAQTQRSPVDMQRQMQNFNGMGDGMAPLRNTTGLSRSNSLAQGSKSPISPLSRSTSVKIQDSREVLVEKVKEIEIQRDTLHRALKSLLERQEMQNREHLKRIKQLENDRDKKNSNSPRRGGYNKEVEDLRTEVNVLRQRAEDAMEQKWQCEKGLSGLKMDLDRAEQEIGSLRSLMKERDILVMGTGAGPRRRNSEVSSAALEDSYQELRKVYAVSLDRIKELERSASSDSETATAMAQLQQSLDDALTSERHTKHNLDALSQSNAALRESEKEHLSEEVALAGQLRASALRVEGLSAQVRAQLDTNATLRGRLASAIERGEAEQHSNVEKITMMQTRLKSLEDALRLAQTASEEAVARHEDDLRALRAAYHAQLQRTKDGLIRSPRTFSPQSPLSPLFANANGTSLPRMPRMTRTRSGAPMSVSEESKVDFLKNKVVSLERALADADKEMEEVVSRMNMAQIEVLELQSEREEAVRETRRLKATIEEEKQRVFEGRFRTLQSASGV